NDANASCKDSSGTAVTCDISTCKTCTHFADAGKTAYTGPYKVTATANSYCQNSSFSSVACTTANAEGYVQVTTSISYPLMIAWPGLPNPLNIGGSATIRTQ